MITKQAIFNKAVNGLLKQKKPAVNKDGDCKYKTASGLKCAVGFSIPDDKYKKSFEGEQAIDTLIEVGVIPEKLPSTQWMSFFRFLCDLQDAHDFAASDFRNKVIPDFMDGLKPELKNVARRYKLKMPAALKK